MDDGQDALVLAEMERHREDRERDRRESKRKSKDDVHEDRDRQRDRRARQRDRERRDKTRRKDKGSRRRRRDGSEAPSSRSRSRGGKSDSSDSSGAKPSQPTKVAVVPVAPAERKVRGLGGFGDTPAPDATHVLSNFGGVAPDEPSGGRQVGCRGSWAEFATPDSRAYFVNILTGDKQWSRPSGYENNASSRAAGKGGSGTTGHSNLYVGGLPAGINEANLRQLCEPYGVIKSLKVVPQAYYGFVKYSRAEEAQTAINMMNGSVLGGVQLQVRFANMDRAW